VGSVLQICLDAGSNHSGEDLASGDVLPSLLSGANVAGFIKVADGSGCYETARRLVVKPTRDTALFRILRLVTLSVARTKKPRLV
jgi:hypothetical protein